MFDKDKYQNLVQWALEQGVKLQLEHIEMMAAAYFSKTDVDPRDVVLVQEQQGWNRTVFYFSTKDELKKRGIVV